MELNDTTYYEILNCDEKASLNEIKANFHKLAKTYHPDKNKDNSENDFVKVHEAWKVLSDDKKRKEYDASICSNRTLTNHLVYDEISIENIEFDDNGVFTHLCRCGGTYVLEKTNLSKFNQKIVVECDDCSFVLLFK